MTETTSGIATPSDKVSSFLGRMHPMTRFLIVVAILELAATLVESVTLISRQTGSSVPLGELVALQVKSVSYALTFFGSAASVEFLFRIWDELKRGGPGVSRSAPGSFRQGRFAVVLRRQVGVGVDLDLARTGLVG